MSSFGDFFTSGNIKVAANRIASSFSDASHNYTLTYDEITKEMASNATSAKNSHFVQLVIDNKIKNLEELTCLYLNTFIGPKNTSFKQTKHDFEEEVRRCLKTAGIPEEYISGDNTHLTEQNHASLVDLSNEQDRAAQELLAQNKNKEKKLKFSTIFLTLTLTLFVSYITTQQFIKKPDQLEKSDRMEKPGLLKLRALALSGNLKSQYALGSAYEKGNGIQQNDEEAVKWYRKAAEGNYLAAQQKLGSMYYRGRGVSKNYEEAFRWYQKSAEQGYAISQFNLGIMYYNGRGIPKDIEEALNWFNKGAEQGHKEAQYNLGFMYHKGQGVPQDYKLAAHWFHEAAIQGQSMAQYNLGLQYAHGRGVVRNEETAEYWIKKSAAQGVARAQVYLGDKYRRINSGIPKERRVTNDFVMAKDWYRKAAEQGDAEGQFKLSEMASKRYGAVVSEEEAFLWLITAAKQGHKHAQLSLGHLFAEGRGNPNRDGKTAAYWYRKAAEQGDPEAKRRLKILMGN